MEIISATFVLLSVCFAYFPYVIGDYNTRVIGGSVTSIEKYPSTASVLLLDVRGTTHICGGVVLTQRHILTAAHCFKAATSLTVDPSHYKVRVGSTYAHSGGQLHRINLVMFHPQYHSKALENDLAIMRTESLITYSNGCKPATIAGFSYRLRDNESLWAVGWGITSETGHESEQLRNVEVLYINQKVCKGHYRNFRDILETMMCAGWLDGGGHDQCTRDSGSPIYHKEVVVGIASQGMGCGNAEFPGVNVRVSRYATWIREKTGTTNIKS